MIQDSLKPSKSFRLVFPLKNWEYNLSNKSVIICCLFIVTRRSTEKVPGVFICSKAYSCFFPYNTLEVSFSETFCFTVRTFSSKRWNYLELQEPLGEREVSFSSFLIWKGWKDNYISEVPHAESLTLRTNDSLPSARKYPKERLFRHCSFLFTAHFKMFRCARVSFCLAIASLSIKSS